MLLTKEFVFDAAHFIPDYPGKCAAPHGHTYRLEVTIQGLPGERGMVMDFAKLGEIVKTEVLSLLDHAELNQLIPNPTCENIALFIWQKLNPFFNLFSLRLWEGFNNSVIMQRDDFKSPA